MTFLLEGVVRRSGARLRITSQLTNALDGRLLWSERWDRDTQDVFRLEDEITRIIVDDAARHAARRPRRSHVPRRYTSNPKAWHLYLRGRHAWNRRGREGILDGIRFFEEAIAEDPNYAPAYSGLSDCYAILLDYRGVPVAEGMDAGQGRSARSALELDASLAEAHTSLGLGHLHLRLELGRGGARVPPRDRARPALQRGAAVVRLAAGGAGPGG